MPAALVGAPLVGECARADAVAALAGAGAFSMEAPPRAVVNALLVASQLARSAAGADGRSCAAALAAARLERFLSNLLAHDDGQVRAKACNLVGNLCRHAVRRRNSK